MKLQTFSVVGDALNFGARRMETIMRVAWLPVVLLLLVEMATAFSLISVFAGRIVTFADFQSWSQVEGTLDRVSALIVNALFKQGSPVPSETYLILGSSFALQAILVASFMAPLIRFAGLGERPSPGVVKLAFGPDQIRFLLAGLLSFLIMAVFVFAPIGATAYYVVQYLVEALSQTYARFPNPDSLHTIELVTAHQTLTERGEIWLYNLGLPLAAAAPFALAFWMVLFAHFSPKHRPDASGARSPVQRAMSVLAALAGIVLLIWIILSGSSGVEIGAPGSQFLAVASLALVITYFVNLRLLPYQGVAVCRRSMAFAGTFSVTRGWNLLYLLAAMVVIVSVVGAVQYLINTYLFVFIGSTINTLYAATLTATKLTHSGEAATWVLPLFVWIWNGMKILVNILLTFFSYGVAAGLFGRLYRESERTES